MTYRRSSSQRHGRCETYFVENDDLDGLYAIRAAARERTRLEARFQQKRLAEELSRVTSYDYSDEILEHMEHMESETMPDVNSIDIQTEIKWFMRPYLLDFLIEAHAAFQLLPETLSLAVNLLDRYCSRRVVYKHHYQLVGCAALLIAAKYGDKKERVPNVKELKSMCCNLYDDEMFTQMEWHVLQTLNWMIGHPTVDSFLQLALSEVHYDPEVEHMTWYICEIALYHREFVSTRPSVLARSALALARCILGRQAEHSPWAKTYDSNTVIALSERLCQVSQVLTRKYASMHLSSVSTIVEDFMTHQAQIARRCAAPPSPPAIASAEQRPASNQYLNPQTPQKTHYGAVVQHGVVTPPFTPDGEQFGDSKDHAVHQRVYPSTPTPSSIPQHSHYNYQPYLQVQHGQ